MNDFINCIDCLWFCIWDVVKILSLFLLAAVIGKYFFRFVQIFVIIIKKLASTSLITEELRERLLNDE